MKTTADAEISRLNAQYHSLALNENRRVNNNNPILINGTLILINERLKRETEKKIERKNVLSFCFISQRIFDGNFVNVLHSLSLSQIDSFVSYIRDNIRSLILTELCCRECVRSIRCP